MFELSALKIRLTAYPYGLHRIKEGLSAEDLSLETEIFSEPLLVNMDLDRHDPYLQFVFSVETSITLQCDRCLADYEQPFNAHGPMIYVLGNPPAGEKVDDPEVSFIPLTTTELDVTVDLRDLILLALPEKRLCSEDCKGLCPVCGADLNLHPCGCGRSVEVV